MIDQRSMPVSPVMSAIDPKRTSIVAPHTSAFGGKADTTFRGSPLLRSLLGVKRTSLFAAQMSAFDPKRTLSSYAEFSCLMFSNSILLKMRTAFEDS
jgi:hypothetical protein